MGIARWYDSMNTKYKSAKEIQEAYSLCACESRGWLCLQKIGLADHLRFATVPLVYYMEEEALVHMACVQYYTVNYNMRWALCTYTGYNVAFSKRCIRKGICLTCVMSMHVKM